MRENPWVTFLLATDVKDVWLLEKPVDGAVDCLYMEYDECRKKWVIDSIIV